jgi:hypothetical protein
MQLRERAAGGSPFRWILEAVSDGQWQREYEMALLVWNVLGRRSERIYQNFHLAARDPRSYTPNGVEGE